MHGGRDGRISRSLVCAGAGAVVYGCVVAPLHPGNPNAADDICSAGCGKEIACGLPNDMARCVNDCRSGMGPRFQYSRPDYFTAVKACIDRTACGPNLDQRLKRACLWDTRMALVPSARAVKFCEGRFEKTRYCVMTTVSVDKCLEGAKVYSDEILAQLDECRDDRICNNYGRCLMSIVGPDVSWEDRDRWKEWGEQPGPGAPRRSVHFAATVFVSGEPWPGVLVCVDRHPELPCGTT